ncbi:zinc finger protein 862-like [Scyliorhinus canicula]|uniref:zinc finger protein 862-like n=1 Tax=Scyliorhinus canicula TaxID=7830 RepID=UPI0018F713EE|nr:zinc finger protein 862-like [Scyliorhinus canicula]
MSPSSSFLPPGSEEASVNKRQQEASKSRDGQLPELEAAFREVFAQYDSAQAHAHYKCQRLGCERVQSDYRRGDKFVHKWLSDRDLTYCERTGVYWLLYEESQGMYCYLCRRHDTQNKQNKTKVFNGTPAVRYKKSALQVHAESQQHAAAVHAELTGRMSEREMAEKEKEEGAALHALFLAAYWLAREDLPTAKLLSVLRLLAEAGLKGATHFRRSDTLQEVFLSLGQVIRSRLVSRVKQAGCYGLLSDQVTASVGADVEDSAALMAFVQYVDPKTAEVLTNFLFVQAVRRRPESDFPEELAGLISRTVAQLELPIQRMASLVTDGGEVMTAESAGVAARLRELNPSLITFHCLCHRLMLAGALTCPDCHYLLRVESYLEQLWELLEKCQGLAEAYLSVRLDKALPSGRLRCELLRRLRRACRRRRVSFDSSVEGAYNDYGALLQALSRLQDTDAAACGLLGQLRNVRFAGALYILREVSPILAGLSKVFRKGTVNYFTLEPSIKYTVYKLNEAAGSREALTRLKTDLLPTGRLASTDLPLPSPEQEAELGSLLDAYVTAVKGDLQRRFGGSLSLVSAFSIFNPLLVPAPESPDFADYGQPEIRTLAAHFYRGINGGEAKVDQLLGEWGKLKFDLHTWKNNVPDSVLTDTRVTVTEWCLRRLFTLKSELHRSCATLLPLAEVSLSMPITNAWSERGFGALRRIAAHLRGGRADLLDSLMHISVNGPDFGTVDCSQIVQEAALLFLQQRRRRFGGGMAGAGSLAQEKLLLAPAKWEEGAEVCYSEVAGVQSEQELEQLQQELDETLSSLQLPVNSDSEDSLCD